MMVKKAPQIHTDDLHVCESNFVKYKNLNSVGVSGIFFFFTKLTYLKFILYLTPLSLTLPPQKKRLSQSTMTSQINILSHFKQGACLHLNVAM